MNSVWALQLAHQRLSSFTFTISLLANRRGGRQDSGATFCRRLVRRSEPIGGVRQPLMAGANEFSDAWAETRVFLVCSPWNANPCGPMCLWGLCQNRKELRRALPRLV